ncbi:MAG: hypothetical protein KF708_11310 [Pirellulales bacterium]|nr:hypothetical protein [Pirellulales bacterium]
MAKSKKSQLRVTTEGNELCLRAGRGSWGVAAFMTIWMAGWSAGCVMLLFKFRWDMPLEDLIFPIPFFVGWLFGALVWASMIFGNEVLWLGPEGVRHRYRWWFLPVQWRDLPLHELKSVDSFSEVEGSGKNRSVTSGLQFRTYGAPLRFGQSLDHAARVEASRVVGQHLRMLQSKSAGSSARRQGTLPPAAADGLFAASSTGPQARSGGLLLTDEPGSFQRPVECCYRLDRTFEGVDFVWRGKSMLIGSCAILALNLFWNTIVIVFALQLVKDFRLDHFFFLVPFAVIGLAMFVGWLAALLQPFFKERWRFTRAEIEHRFTVCWIGPRWRYNVIPLSHLELRRDEDSKKPFWERGKAPPDESGASEGVVARRSARRAGMTGKMRRPINLQPSQFGRDFMLVLVAADGEPLCTIKHLHEGEARWIADVLRGEFAGWFAR